MMYTIGFIAEQIGGRVIGNSDRKIGFISPMDDIESGSIVFIKDKRNLKMLSDDVESLCVIVDFEPEEGTNLDYIVIEPDMKDAAFIKLLSLFESKRVQSGAISEKALVSSDASIGKNVTVSDFVSIGENTTVQADTYIGPHTFIGDNCKVGRGCIIYPNVTIYQNTILEDKVILHSGTVIGSDGFSYLNIDRVNQKIPQIGGVHIGKNVEIGANTTIDRATIGYTKIGENTKIDNLVQIAHNCVIGKNTIICGLCGIAGSVKIGDNVVIAGAVGLADHITIEDNVFIGPKSGVMKKVVKKGSNIVGTPATDYKTEMNFFAMKPKIKEMYYDVRKLKQKLGL